MNRADAMLAVLRINEGSWWTRQEIFRWSDRYFLTNNAAAELRARGFNVEHAKRGQDDLYRLGASGLPSDAARCLPPEAPITPGYSVKV